MKRFPAPSRKAGQSFGWASRLLVAFALVGTMLWLPKAIAGLGNLGGNAVGGIMIDAAGLVRSATQAERADLLARMRTQLAEPQGDLAAGSELRMVSLKKLQAAIARELQTGEEIPADMKMLAGLQRIEYVFVYPERNDIVLAGPAEPWVIREDASVVGKFSGRPTLLLSDLLTAFQSVEPSRQGGISCSIEPTAEGRQRLQRMLARVRLQPGQDPRNLEPMMREAYGPQIVKLAGIPTDSHYARVLLAADYQMKRIAMALEDSPVAGLPSYLEMARNERQLGNENPRWWMACNYDSLKHDQGRLAWQLSGQGVKTLTAQDQFDAAGQAQASQRENKTAKKWAELMTDRFNDLAARQSIFGDLRNVMDMSVVATLIMQEGLDQTAGCDLSVMLGQGVQVPTTSYEVPQAVAPQCSFVKGRAGWTVTASGGVEVTPFNVVENQTLDNQLAEVHARAKAEQPTTWWWNG